MPELCKEIIESQSQNHLIDLSLTQLRSWFTRLVLKASTSCRMFFHIDGIDEYEGDCLGTAKLITDTAGMKSGRRSSTSCSSERRSPSCVFWTVPPRFQKKCEAVTRWSSPAHLFKWDKVCRSSRMYFINVDFPDPAFPLIQKHPWPDSNHWGKSDQGLFALFGGWKMQLKVAL